MTSLTDEEILNSIKGYTLTSLERQQHTLKTVEYVVKNNILGDIIEIGVWRGGTVMLILQKLLQLGITNRIVHLYDTFYGMTEEGPDDVDLNGHSASQLMITNTQHIMARCDYDSVYKNVSKIGYPMDMVKFHKGDIRNVDVKTIPEQISILRLDNDWYELYKFELPIFEPNVVKNGVIIIDDYGHWRGCKKAVDEFLLSKGYPTSILKTIDYTSVFWIKDDNYLGEQKNNLPKIFETRDKMIDNFIVENMIGCEIGVFKGEFSDLLLSKNPRKLYLVDLFEGWMSSGNKDGHNSETLNLTNEFYKLLTKHQEDNRVHIIKSKSGQFLSCLKDDFLDYIYIDGDHSYQGCKIDLEHARKVVKNGGFIMGHDYIFNKEKNSGDYPPYFGVNKAVNEFCENYKLEIEALGFDGCVSYCIINKKNK